MKQKPKNHQKCLKLDSYIFVLKHKKELYIFFFIILLFYWLLATTGNNHRNIVMFFSLKHIQFKH